MKRKLALLVLVILITSVVLVACTQTEKTEKVIRWDRSGEEYTFNITLVDPNTDFSFKEVNGTNYYKELAVSTGEVLASKDEVRPEKLIGTYYLKIQPSAEGTAYCDVTTVQTIYAQYFTEDLKNSDRWSEVDSNGFEQGLKKFVTSQEEDPFEPSDTLTTLKSVTETSVRFQNTTNQTPMTSSTKVSGFYIGKIRQEVSEYEVSTTYDFKSKRPTATVVYNGEETVYELPKNINSSDTSARLIDANQLLTYVRSFDKKPSSFQDSPSAYVFIPATGTTLLANFGYSYAQNLILTDSTRATDNEMYSKITTVGVTLGGIAYMVQENLPDRLLSLKLDSIQSGTAASIAKLTTVRFRVGYFAYELASYADDVWNALFAERFTRDYKLIESNSIIKIDSDNCAVVTAAYDAYSKLTEGQQAAIDNLLKTYGEKDMAALYAEAQSQGNEQ